MQHFGAHCQALKSLHVVQSIVGNELVVDKHGCGIWLEIIVVRLGWWQWIWRKLGCLNATF